MALTSLLDRAPADQTSALWLRFALVVVVSVLGTTASASTPDPARAAEVKEGLTATCLDVDAKTRRIAVITAVGHAMRIVRFEVAPACVVKVAGSQARLEALAGQIVRIRFQKVAGRAVALSIETLPPEPTSPL